MKKLFIVILYLAVISCNKEEEGEEQKTGLVGKWKLTEYYMSIGGPGTWQQADPQKPAFIIFDDQGNVSYIPDNQYAAKKYRITSDTTLLMIRTNDELKHGYRLNGNKLEIFPPCIEGCASKYISVSK